MKQKHKYFNRFTVSALAALIIAAGAGVVLKHNTTEAAPSSKTQPVASRFSFTGATDWRQGPSNETSMALFHGYDCFTSVEYKTGTVDAATELQKLSATQAGGGTSTPGDVLTTALQTNAGPQQYELHQYALSSGAGEKLMEGLELGFLQLKDGYVEVQGHCDTPEELPVTIPALQAIKFDAN